MTTKLSPHLRRTAVFVAEVFYPGTGTLPGAGSVDVGGRPLDDLLEVRPDLAAQFIEGLEWAADLNARDLSAMVDADPDRAELLFLVLSAVYLEQKSVKNALHYPGQQPRPFTIQGSRDYLRDDLLAPVIAAGSRYVPTPVD